ncbi:MAG TPA: CmcI family methyltransferase [Acidobacteriaceae bacterium]|nr:CmcI family methyltransferase [Acidobacteriaceae bacterium]
MFPVSISGLFFLVLLVGLIAAGLCIRLDIRRRHLRRGALSSLLLLDLAAPAVLFALAAMWFAAIWALVLVRHVTVAGGTTEGWWLAESFAYAAAGFFVWNLGSRHALEPRAPGLVFAASLIAAGIIQIPFHVLHSMSMRGPWAFIFLGAILLFVFTRQFRRQRGEHRILQHVAMQGDVLQPEYHRATPECPEPDRWRMYDSMTAEFEVLAFLQQLVETLKPKIIVETGTFMGISTLWLAQGLKANGAGKVITCEYDPVVYAKAAERIEASGLKEWIEARNESSLEMQVDGEVDLLFSDSDPDLREAEVRRFLPMLRANGIILIHDASSHLKTVRDAALKLEREGLISVVLLSTPRGLVIAQKRAGRTE